MDETPADTLLSDYFLFMVPDMVNRRRYKELRGISRGSVINGIVGLKLYLSWKYEDFHLRKTTNTRLLSHLNDFVNEGSIWKGVHKPKVYVRSRVIKRMVLGHLKSCLFSGCFSSNWTTVVKYWLGILLMCALDCRVGELLRTIDYGDAEVFMEWSDITIKIGPHRTINDLLMSVRVRFEKGVKYVYSSFLSRSDVANLYLRRNVKGRERFCEIRPHDNTDDSIVDVVLVVLVLALRLGQTSSSNIEEVLTLAANRKDRRIVWKNNRLPLLESAKSPGQPLSTSALTKAVARFGRDGGVLERVTAHNIRHGASRDLLDIGPSLAQVGATEAVASHLGHSNRAFTTGVTSGYTGRVAKEIFNRKISLDASEFVDDDITFNEVAVGSSYKRRRVTSDRIDEYLETAEKGTTRHAATNALKKKDFEAHCEIEKNAPRAPTTSVLQPPTCPPLNHQLIQKTREPTEKTQEPTQKTREPTQATAFRILAEKDRNAVVAKLDATRVEVSLYPPPDQQGTDENISPYYMTPAKRTHSTTREDDADGDRDTQELQALEDELEDEKLAEALDFDNICASVDPLLLPTSPTQDLQRSTRGQDDIPSSTWSDPRLAILQLPAVEFVRAFSKINTIAYHSDGKENGGLNPKQPPLPVGSSCDPFTWLQFVCNNAQFGCPYTAIYAASVRQHETTCQTDKITADAAARIQCDLEADDNGGIHCTSADCSEEFSTRAERRDHVISSHPDLPFPPQLCDHPCGSRTIYYTLTSLQSHIYSSCSQVSILRYPCPIKPCSSDHLYVKSNLKVHLRKIHKLDNEAMKAHLPSTQRRPRTKKVATPAQATGNVRPSNQYGNASTTAASASLVTGKVAAPDPRVGCPMASNNCNRPSDWNSLPTTVRAHLVKDHGLVSYRAAHLLGIGVVLPEGFERACPLSDICKTKAKASSLHSYAAIIKHLMWNGLHLLTRADADSAMLPAIDSFLADQDTQLPEGSV